MVLSAAFKIAERMVAEFAFVADLVVEVLLKPPLSPAVSIC